MKNSFVFDEATGSYKIYFNSGKFFLIDQTDFPEVSKYSWQHGKRGYPICHYPRDENGKSKTVTLHRFLLGEKAINLDVDHISGDKLDNRRSNLRVCSHQENMFNQNLRSTNTSGYIGVSQMKSTGKYEAYIHPNGKKISLGTYTDIVEAATVRDRAALKHFGKFARLNFPVGAVTA